MKRTFAVLFSTLFLSTLAFALPGELDLTFGGTGISKIGFDEGDDRGYSTAVQSDGKIVVAGRTFNGQKYLFGVARYNTNGSLDSTFDSDGLVSTEFPGSAEARSVAIQADGKIVVSGQASSNVAVVRYNPNGSLDPTFDSDGIATANFGGLTFASGIAIDFNGKIIVGGSAFFSGEYNFAVFRFNPDGSLDTSFDSDGIATTEITALENDILRSVAVQPDGTIVAVGDNDTSFVVVQYMPDGSLDTAFDGDGIVTTNVSNNGSASVAYSVVIDTFGANLKIVVTGYAFIFGTGFNFAVVRYDLDGSLDPSFSSDGIVITSITNDADFGYAGAIQQSDGKIVVAGSSRRSVNNIIFKEFAAIRYNDDGSLDTTFGGDGIVTTQIDTGDAEAQAIAYKPGGKIVLAGHSSISSEQDAVDDFTLVQYNSDGTPDTSFDTDGKVIHQWSHFPSVARGIALQPDGKLIVAGDSNNSFAVVRFNANGTLDTTFGNRGKTRISFGGFASANAVAVQPDGKIVVVGSNSPTGLSDVDFAIARLNPNGTRDFTFDFDGIKIVSFGTQQDIANSVAVAPGGKIFVGGIGNVGFNLWDFAALSLNSDGSFDSSFDSDGKVTTNIGGISETIKSIVVQPDGKIVGGGYTFTGLRDVGGAVLNDFAVVRYNSNGSLDTSFGTSGFVTTRITPNDSRAHSVSLQSDGKIVVAGENRFDAFASIRFAVVRYNPNGTLDNTFGTGGIVTTVVGVDDAGAFTSAVQTDGKIVVGGYATIIGTTTFYSQVYAIVRYNPDGTLDSPFSGDTANSWGTGGIVTIDLSDGEDKAFGLQIDLQGRVVVVGESNGSFGVIRLQGNAVTAANVSVSGRVLSEKGTGVQNAIVSLTKSDGSLITVRTNSFGLYRFDDLAVGQSCFISVRAKGFQFSPRFLTINEELSDVDFVPESGDFSPDAEKPF